MSLKEKIEEFNHELIEFILTIMPTIIVVLLICCIALIVVKVNLDCKEEEKVKQCFLQQIENTPECKYLIHKQNNKNKKTITPVYLPIGVSR